MEDCGNGVFDGINSTIRRKRSQPSRRPRPDSQISVEGYDRSPSSSTTPSDDMSKISSDEIARCDINTKRKEFNLNQCVYREEYADGKESENTYKKIKRVGDIGSSEVAFTPSHSKKMTKMIYGLESKSRFTSVYSEVNSEHPSFGDDNKVKKVKLKVGSMTRTIQGNSAYNGVSGSESSRTSDSHRHQQQLIMEAMADNSHFRTDKRSNLQGIPWKDFSVSSFRVGREDSTIEKMSNDFGKEGDKSEPVRKSKRVPKIRLLDEEFGVDDDDEDEEIRYLEKIKNSKAPAKYKEDDEESSKKHLNFVTVSDIEMPGTLRSQKDGKKSRSDRVYKELEYEEEGDSASDIEVEVETKKQRKESREMTLTTRQRALQSSRETSSCPGGSLIEFPNGLPPAPPRKQKEKLSEVEQHLKKVEAAQKRRMQVEKAARESEAEAIRKILGQDSNRKKKEEKLKKRRDELAQEKAANARKLASNTIRWILGPCGTVVTFPSEMGLPSILKFKACSYPSPRENCVGPSCDNPYKYRDSKWKLPLCSLHCYKAIQEKKMLAETTC